MWSSLVASHSGGYPMLSHDCGECPREMGNRARVIEAIGVSTARRAGTNVARCRRAGARELHLVW
jgi:hypothetical protein